MKVFLAVFTILQFIVRKPAATSSQGCPDRVSLSSDITAGTCSSDFQLLASRSSYVLGEPVQIVMQSINSNRSFVGIHLFAEDEHGNRVGQWKTSDAQLIHSSCQSLSQSSSTSSLPLKIVRGDWYPSINTRGNVRIKAILIENPKIVHFDCYHLSLTAQRASDPITVQPSNDKTSSLPASPTADVSVNVSWVFHAPSNATMVRMTINNLKASQWAAIGLAQERGMGKAHVFICKRLSDDTITIDRYINPSGHQYPEPADNTDGGVMTPGDQLFHDGLVICQFNLSNFTSIPMNMDPQAIRPLSPSTQYYPIFAVGLLDSDNDPQKHAKDSRAVQKDLVQLNQNEIILYKISNGDLTTTKLLTRLHGILMSITWIFLVSTGILISRYFKHTTHLSHVCGVASWFTIHRSVMCLATILSTLAFVLILVSMQGAWIERGWTKSFLHAVIGAIVISSAFIQPFIALFRCEPSHSRRFIFNAIHRLIGFLAFILSLIVLYLATSFPLFSNDLPRWMMIGWICWIGIIFFIFELIEKCYGRRSNETEEESLTRPLLCHQELRESRYQQRLKISLLFTHLILAATMCIIFVRFLI